MNLNVEIVSFQAIQSSESAPGVLIVVGKGSDGWMYQFLGEEGIWTRLSKKYPASILLPGVAESPIHSTTTTNMDIEKPMTDEQVSQLQAETIPPATEALTQE